MDLCSLVFFTLHILKSCEVLAPHSGTAQNASFQVCYVEATGKSSSKFRRVVEILIFDWTVLYPRYIKIWTPITSQCSLVNSDDVSEEFASSNFSLILNMERAGSSKM